MDKIKVADLVLDTERKEAKRSGKSIPLTRKEYELLYYLMKHQGQVVQRSDLLKNIWRYPADIESRVVDVYIGYLRKKIDVRGKKKLIRSIRGFGYSIK